MEKQGQEISALRATVVAQENELSRLRKERAYYSGNVTAIRADLRELLVRHEAHLLALQREYPTQEEWSVAPSHDTVMWWDYKLKSIWRLTTGLVEATSASTNLDGTTIQTD